MESDHGKLFIGGISWDTNEDRLKEYFGKYGEVVETVIMRDRATGRARGFGFVVFADLAVAERVIVDKHMIDGRVVEAKKAVPRDDQQILNRNANISHGSPGPGRTKKIFVGGLASTVTETDFKNYFEQFGNITDVVVMYDHNTQRPRGFGFITYDSEESVEHVLHKTFHELNGKMVEVKRAVPKELSPGPTRSPLIGYNNYGLNRANSFLSSYNPGYNINSLGGIGMRIDGRFNNPLTIDRTGFGFPPFGSSGLTPAYGGTSNFGSRALSPYYNANSSRYNTPIGYNARNDSILPQTNRNVWGNGGFNTATTNPNSQSAYLGSAGFGTGGGSNWGASPVSAQLGGNSSSYPTQLGGGMSYWGTSGDNSYGLGGNAIVRNSSSGIVSSASFAGSIGGGYEGSYSDLPRGSSMYSDSTWRSTTPDLDGSGSFGYGLGNIDSDVKSSEGYIGSYGTVSRQSTRGIAT